MSGEQEPPGHGAGVVFVVSALFFIAWNTLLRGFHEIASFPNYPLLAQSYAAGHTWVAPEALNADFVVARGEAYVYFGPVPALLRLPFMALGLAVPTGLGMALGAAGICAAIWALLGVADPAPAPHHTLRRGVFLALTALNGYTLLVTAIPLVHHEAILCGTAFLLAGLQGVLSAARDGWRVSPARSAWTGLCLALSLASRFTSLLTVTLALAVLAGGTWRHAKEARRRTLVRLAPAVAACGISFVALLGYNEIRFGDPLEFGIASPYSVYAANHADGHHLRYDHVPFNTWSYFFRLPRLQREPPYLVLPFYIQDVRERWSTYQLVNGNELCVSVFVLMPVLLLAAAAFAAPGEDGERAPRLAARLLAAATATQMAPLLVSEASTARYCLEFVPLLFVLTALGARAARARVGPARLLALAVVSWLISLAVVANGLVSYQSYLGYRAPLLDLVTAFRTGAQ